jgi:hypothetical protein
MSRVWLAALLMREVSDNSKFHRPSTKCKLLVWSFSGEKNGNLTDFCDCHIAII